MDQTTSTNFEGDMLWLTDKDGNSYLVRRDVIEGNRVPNELQSEIKEFIESDTHGYGDAKWLLEGILTHFGAKLGQKEYDQNFDLNNDSVINSQDYAIAKKAWYEQQGQITTTSPDSDATAISTP